MSVAKLGVAPGQRRPLELELARRVGRGACAARPTLDARAGSLLER